MVTSRAPHSITSSDLTYTISSGPIMPWLHCDLYILRQFQTALYLVTHRYEVQNVLWKRLDIHKLLRNSRNFDSCHLQQLHTEHRPESWRSSKHLLMPPNRSHCLGSAKNVSTRVSFASAMLFWSFAHLSNLHGCCRPRHAVTVAIFPRHIELEPKFREIPHWFLCTFKLFCSGCRIFLYPGLKTCFLGITSLSQTRNVIFFLV